LTSKRSFGIIDITQQRRDTLAVMKTYQAFDARGWKQHKTQDRMITLYVQGMHGAVQHDLSMEEVLELQELLQKAVAQSGEEAKENPWNETPF
jgi:hypothetical protein